MARLHQRHRPCTQRNALYDGGAFARAEDGTVWWAGVWTQEDSDRVGSLVQEPNGSQIEYGSTASRRFQLLVLGKLEESGPVVLWSAPLPPSSGFVSVDARGSDIGLLFGDVDQHGSRLVLVDTTRL